MAMPMLSAVTPIHYSFNPNADNKHVLTQLSPEQTNVHGWPATNRLFSTMSDFDLLSGSKCEVCLLPTGEHTAPLYGIKCSQFWLNI